jgi:acetyl esterase/lipase
VRTSVFRLGALALILLALCKASFATPLDAAQQLPMRILRDVPYGPDRAQRFDVYAPGAARGAPVIVMVHGGGWAFGDKSARGVVENKVARWVPRGFIVVSTNYRMLPGADPLAQAKDVARAIAMAQKQAASWGGDRTKFLLMGHSAGAHLVALLTAAPRIADQTPVTPWLGAVSIESGAMNVVDIMEGRHARLYDRAFGRDRAFWTEVSPYHALTSAGAPIALVCSTRRGSSCDQAERFAARAQSLGMRAVVLRENLSHAAADAQLGLDNAYTREVEAFMRSLDESVARALAPPDSSRGTR